jgi:acyl carrier protein
MDRETLRRELMDLLESETGDRPADLDDGVQLREGLGLDSVDVVSLVMQIEGRYRIRLTQAELEKAATVGALLTLIQGKIAPTAAAA